MDYNNLRYVSLEEQLVIFLYMSVTGLTIRYIGECFHQSNENISQYGQFL
jgi:phosphate starvation-inducible membrane PsiE